MTTRKTDIRPHIVPAHLQWVQENYQRAYVAFVTTHPDVVIPVGTQTTNMEVPVLIDVDMDDPNLGEVIRMANGDPIITVEATLCTLDFGVEAVGKFQFGENGIIAHMRFSGNAFTVNVPFSAVVAVYSPDDPTTVLSVPMYYGQEDVCNNSAVKAAANLTKVVSETNVGKTVDAEKKPRPKLTVVK